MARRVQASEVEEDLGPLLDGDKAAWNRFVGRYARVIYAAVQRRLVPAGRSDGADDVAQDVFLRLCDRDFRLLRNYDPGRARLTTWLTVIATSTAIDHLRRTAKATTPLDQVPEARIAVEPKLPERIKIPPELLSPRQAVVLEMLYRRDMDVAEVAQVLAIDRQTVRSTHHKAMIKLRAHFQGELT